MSDLGRFRKLERKRADDADDPRDPRDADDLRASSSGRFGKIEARRGEPDAPPKTDPFAPPPERTSALELREDDRRQVQAMRAAHNAQTEASLAIARAERNAERELFQPPRGPLLKLDTRDRLALLAGGTLAIAGSPRS